MQSVILGEARPRKWAQMRPKSTANKLAKGRDGREWALVNESGRVAYRVRWLGSPWAREEAEVEAVKEVEMEEEVRKTGSARRDPPEPPIGDRPGDDSRWAIATDEKSV